MLNTTNNYETLARLHVKYIEIFVKSVMANPFIYCASDVTEEVMKEFVSDTVTMINEVVNLGKPIPKQATKLQAIMIGEVSGFIETLFNPFGFKLTPNTVESKTSPC